MAFLAHCHRNPLAFLVHRHLIPLTDLALTPLAFPVHWQPGRTPRPIRPSVFCWDSRPSHTRPSSRTCWRSSVGVTSPFGTPSCQCAGAPGDRGGAAAGSGGPGRGPGGSGAGSDSRGPPTAPPPATRSTRPSITRERRRGWRPAALSGASDPPWMCSGSVTGRLGRPAGSGTAPREAVSGARASRNSRRPASPRGVHLATDDGPWELGGYVESLGGTWTGFGQNRKSTSTQPRRHDMEYIRANMYGTWCWTDREQLTSPHPRIPSETWLAVRSDLVRTEYLCRLEENMTLMLPRRGQKCPHITSMIYTILLHVDLASKLSHQQVHIVSALHSNILYEIFNIIIHLQHMLGIRRRQFTAGSS